MDPLSLTANIISVVSAASDTLKRLQKSSYLRHAPQELLQFHNEVRGSCVNLWCFNIFITTQISDFQVVLTVVREFSASHDNDDSGHMAIKAHLSELLSRATKALEEFDNVLKNKIGSDQPTSATTPIKFSWRAWRQNASSLRGSVSALRTIKLDMSQTITMMTA